MAGEKLELWDGRHLKRLHALVSERMINPQAAEQVKKYTNVSRNLLRQITKTVAIAYNRGVIRTLGDSVSQDTAKAFAEVVSESSMPQAATLINAYSWLLGPTFVVPVIESDGTFWLDIVGPDRSDVIRQNPRTAGALLYQREDGLFIRLDREGWSYYDSEGEPIKGLASIPHALGYCPAAIFRSKHWAGDWWNTWEHRALVDASYDVAMFEALMNWSRKQGGKQLAIQAPLASLAGKQPIGNPETPLFFDTTNAAGEISIDVLDLDSSAATWLSLIDAKVAGVCELYGLPPSLISGVNSNTDWGQVGLARAPEVLDALRDEQIPWLDRGELQLWPMVCDVLRGSTHRHARALPPGDEVREMLRVHFLEPLPNVKRSLDRLALFTEQEKLGLASVTDLILEERPTLTPEQAEEIVKSNLAHYFARIEQARAMNLPMDTADAAASVAELQGRLGGLTKAENAAANKTESDE